MMLWSGASAKRGRFDYDTPDFRMQEMVNDTFFGDCWSILKPGDYITVTDCEDQVITVRVDLVDKHARKVFLSKMERIYAMPVVEIDEDLPDDPGLVYRYRSPRGGGHSIVTKSGAVFAINFDTRVEAERTIANCYEEKIFEVPAGHEPTEDYVSKNTKIWTAG